MRSRHAPSKSSRFFFGCVVLAVGCSVGDFDAQNKLNSVRILASRADIPYAAPGESVAITVLAHDARPSRPEPMRLSWIPFPCVNPAQDSYFDCFRAFGASRGALPPGADAGVPPRFGDPSGLLSEILKPGVDLTPYLPSGPTFSVTLPADIVETHPPSPGVNEKYGLAIVFNIACAGHVELIEIDPNDLTRQQVPFGCFDATGKRLGPEEYVIGFSRIYAYDTLRNANPVIESVTFEGKPVDLATGITVDRCTVAKADRGTACPKLSLEVSVPTSSQEPRVVGTKQANEQIWASYYSDIGDLDGDARLLYDVDSGRVTDNAMEFLAPATGGSGTIFIVVRDDRGGVDWVDVPVSVR
jgi:hypothetical protein